MLESWEQWFSDAKRVKVLEQIRAIPLNDDDEFLSSLYEQIAMQITNELTTESALKKTTPENAGDMDALSTWFELTKIHKKISLT